MGVLWNLCMKGELPMEMRKEYDKKCQNCGLYDNCLRQLGSKGCSMYEYYKCIGCDLRVPSKNGTWVCYRGHRPTSDIKECSLR